MSYMTSLGNLKPPYLGPLFLGTADAEIKILRCLESRAVKGSRLRFR